MRRPSLKGIWYVSLLVASILPALVLAPWLEEKGRDMLLANALLEKEMLHRELLVRLHQEQRRLRTILTNKSDPIGILLSIGDKQGVKIFLNKIIEREPLFNTLEVFGEKGEPFAYVKEAGHTLLELEAMDPAYAIPMHGRPFLGSPQWFDDGHYEFMIAVPVEHEGHVLGALVGLINIDDFLQSVISGEASEQQVFLVDSRGRLLTELQGSNYGKGVLLTHLPSVRRLLEGRIWRERQTYEGVNGYQVFALASPVPELQWGMVSEIPKDLIYSPIIETLVALVLIVFLLHVVFGLSGMLVARRVTEPIGKLLNDMRRVAQTEGKLSITPIEGCKEFVDLSRSLQSMLRALEQREERLREAYQALDQAGEAIVITDIRGQVEYANKAFSRTFGYPFSVILGRSLLVLLKGNPKRKEIFSQMRKRLQQGEIWESSISGENAKGDPIVIDIHIAPVFVEGEIEHFVIILQDITRDKELEEQFRQSQKMESLGVLVGGIAHDFNNILAGIVGNLYLAKKAASEECREGKLGTRLKNIEQLCNQASEMVKHLLMYVRKAPIDIQPMSADHLVRQTMNILRATIQENIVMEVQVPDEPLIIHGDVSALQQVLFNLVINARDAVIDKKDPMISVSLSRIARRDLPPKIQVEGRGDIVRLRVADNGCGIPEEALDKIFDPFFSLKAKSNGTGLGLAMVWGTVQSHHGFIDVHSRVGVGSVFDIYFPLAATTGQPQEEVGRQPQPDEGIADKQGGLILLVDDEENLRQAMEDILEMHGYRVLTAKDGIEAEEYFLRYPDQVRVAILDVIMPRRGGPETAHQLRKHRPDLPIVFMTGYDEGEVINRHEWPNCTILSKPVSIEWLLNLLKRIT